MQCTYTEVSQLYAEVGTRKVVKWKKKKKITKSRRKCVFRFAIAERLNLHGRLWRTIHKYRFPMNSIRIALLAVVMRQFLRPLSPQSLLCRSTAATRTSEWQEVENVGREGGICSEAVSRRPVGRKIMIHSGQIPTLFLPDKILEVSGSVYHETRKKGKYMREAWC